MEDNFNFDDSEIKKIEIPKKEEVKKENIFTKINNSYKEFMRKIKLGFIIDKIDKHFPSLILIVALLLIILGVILFFVFYSPEQEYRIDVYVNNKMVNARLDFKEDIEIVNNTFKYLPNKTLNLEIFYNNEIFEERIKTNNEVIRVDLETSSNLLPKVVDKTFSFSLESKSGLLNKNGLITIECDNYSKEYNIVSGILQNIVAPCDAVSVKVNVEGLPTANQMCGSGLCKIKMNVAENIPAIEQNLSKNKLTVYVNNLDNTPAQGIEISILENKTSQQLIDKGFTKEFGNYTFDLLEGDYIILINDLENRFASQSKEIKITAGAPSQEYFILDLPNIGLLNLSFDVENKEEVSGIIYLLDVNDKIITQKDFNSNLDLEIGIKELGEYKISGNLKSEYSSQYTIIEKELNFTKTQDIKIEIKEFNSYDYQKLVLQVIDSTTQKPIPNAKVYLEKYKNGATSTYIRNVGNSGLLVADFNGIVTQILPIGSYLAILDNYYLDGQANFSIIETQSLTISEVPVKLFVDWGSAVVNVCLNEELNNKKEPIYDAFIEVYNSNNEFIDSYYLNEDNCINLNLKLLQNIYFKISKTGYRDLYTQNFFIHNKGNLNLDFTLTESVVSNKIKTFDYEFLGSYSDVELKNKVSKLENADYYFAFKINIPKEKMVSSNKLYSYGVAGNLIDENYLSSKLIVKNSYGLGNFILYKNYLKNNFFLSDNKIIAEIGEDEYYEAKSYLGVLDFSLLNSSSEDVEMIYVVKAYVTKNNKKDDKINFSFGFNLNGYSDNLKSIKLTFGSECDSDLCLELWQDNSLINSNSVVEISNFGSLTANVEYNYDFKEKFAFYNLGLSENISNLEDIKTFDFFISEGSVFLEGLSENRSETLYNGPVYLYDYDILGTNLLELDFNYNISTNNNTKLNFSVYNEFEDRKDMSINIASLNEESLRNISYNTEFLVPFIENELIVYVEDNSENLIYSGEARYYYYSNGQWVLGDIKNINDGQVKFDIRALALKDKVKIILDVPNYKIYERIFNVNYDFLEFKNISIDLNAPNGYNVIKEIDEVINNSNYNIDIYNGKYLENQDTPSIWEDLLDIESMEAFFSEEDSMIYNNGNMKLKFKYDLDYFKNLKVDNIDIPLDFSFYYLPDNADAKLYGKNSDLNYKNTLELLINIKYDGAIDRDCLILDLKDSEGNSLFGNDKKLIFLEESKKDLYLIVQNNCKINSSTSSELESLDLLISSDNLPINIDFLDSSFSGLDIEIPLDYAKAFNDSEYKNSLTLNIGDFDAILNSNVDKVLSFELKPKYYIQDNLVERNSGFIDKDLFLDFNTFEDCITFELDESKLNYELDKYIIPNTDVLRLPYYLQGELSEKTNIVVTNLNIENADILGRDVRNNAFEINELPLILKNNCGIDLEYKIYISNENAGNIGDFAIIKELNKNDVKNISFRRGDDFSGAVYLDLNVWSLDNKYSNALVKRLKVNVESSLQNRDFVENPFLSQDVEQPVYYNEYYPLNMDEIKNEAFGIDIPVCGITYGQQESYCDSAKIIVKKLPFELNNIYTNFKSFFSDWISYLYLFNTGSNDPTNYDNSKLKYESKWFLFGDFGKQLNNKDCDGDDCDNDDYIWLRYFIYDKKYFSGVNFDFDSEKDIVNLFDNFNISDSLFASKKYFSETEFQEPLRVYSSILGDFLDANSPYFINYGWSTFYGDSQRDRYVHAPTYCPDNTEPVRIYLNTDYKGSIKNKYKKEYELFGEIEQKDGAFGFVHTLYINLADNDKDGYGYSKNLTVCRLLPEEFESKYDRPVGTKNNVTFIKEEKKPMYLGFEESNCMGNGVTGDNVAPKITLDQDANCENLYCNNYQLGNYIIEESKQNESEFYLNDLYLTYDNYSEEAYNLFVNNNFLTDNSYNLKFNVYGDLDIRILPTGRYNAKIKVDNKNIVVDLFYNTYILPDHLFYYMPYLETLPGNNLGTSLNETLSFSGNDNYPYNTDKVPLFEYDLNPNLNIISSALPVVMQGSVNLEDNMGRGEIIFSPNSYSKESFKELKCEDFDCELDIRDSSYAHIWVKYNNKVYDGRLYFNVEKENNKLKVKSKYDDLPFDAKDVYLFKVEKGNNISSISDIINNIEEGNICYKLNNNEYIYYWNVNKLLGE